VFKALLIVAVCTGVAAVMARSNLDHANLIMVYLLGVVYAATALGRWPSVVASVLSVAAFDFFFVEPHLTFAVAETQYLLTFGVMLAVALIVSTLVDRLRRQEEAAHRHDLAVETERHRNALLSSISHDLRTPLAAITGAASSLASDDLDRDVRRDLAQSIADEADRLGRLVRNLLDATRLESGAVRVRKEWYPLEEVVGAALTRLESRLGERPVDVRLPADLPLVPLDAQLVEQVLINLVENALRYSAPEAPIEIGGRLEAGAVVITVGDRGRGLPEGLEDRVFDKFFQARPDAPDRGVGLGLTVCKGIVQAHGGWIRASNREGGGAEIAFGLPLSGVQPIISDEETAVSA
jgi:two-component system sensor histidine kinase KdpD